MFTTAQKSATLALSLFAASLSAMPASAEAPSSRSFTLNATVGTVCRIELTDMLVDQSQGSIRFGAVTRLCNAAEGYRVILQHPTGLAGAAFMMSGQSAPLGSGNESVVFSANRAQNVTSDAELRLAPGQALPASLSFRIEPLSARF
jgi:hypothetical protein